ncbi:MAG: hypothetical protein V4864_06110 [Pseudomonadota bacterium]
MHKTFATLLAAAAFTLACGAAGAKTPLTDAQLDRITAAGSGGTGANVYRPEQTFTQVSNSGNASRNNTSRGLGRSTVNYFICTGVGTSC